MSFTVGTRVRVTEDNAQSARVLAGDLGTVVEAAVLGGSALRVKMDNPRSSAATWSFTPEYLEVVEDALSVGDIRTIVADGYSTDPHGMNMDTEVEVIGAVTDYDGRITVRKTSSRSGWTYYVLPTDLSGVSTPAEPETLASFKIKFLEGAIARAASNGGRHPEQVKVALDHLAGLEYLEPSADLESFQKRVVALAMSKKAEHNWCGEPEAYLTEIGLAHLLPRRMVVEVITEVVVMATPGMSDRDIRTAARAQAATLDDGGSFWTNDPRQVP